MLRKVHISHPQDQLMAFAHWNNRRALQHIDDCLDEIKDCRAKIEASEMGTRNLTRKDKEKLIGRLFSL